MKTFTTVAALLMASMVGTASASTTTVFGNHDRTDRHPMEAKATADMATTATFPSLAVVRKNQHN